MARSGAAGPSRGDSGPSCVDSGPSRGDSGPSRVDSGPSRGDSGPSSGDSGASCGDSGASSGDSGPSGGDYRPSDGDSRPSGSAGAAGAASGDLTLQAGGEIFLTAVDDLGEPPAGHVTLGSAQALDLVLRHGLAFMGAARAAGARGAYRIALVRDDGAMIVGGTGCGRWSPPSLFEWHLPLDPDVRRGHLQAVGAKIC